MVHELTTLRGDARAELVKLGGEAAAKEVEKESSQLFAALADVKKNTTPSEMEAIAKVFCLFVCCRLRNSGVVCLGERFDQCC